MEWLRSAGFSYAEFERRGYGFVVVEASLRYRKPARFDDELVIRTGLADLGRASLVFEYEVSKGGETIASGRTRHGCMDLATGRPGRVPEELRIKSEHG